MIINYEISGRSFLDLNLQNHTCKDLKYHSICTSRYSALPCQKQVFFLSLLQNLVVYLELSNEEACRGFLLFFFISLHLDLEDHPNPLPPFLDTNKTVPLQVPAVLNLLDDNPTPPQTFRGSCKLISREEEQDEEEETNSLVR